MPGDLEQRIPEPELMDGAEQAAAYDAADFAEPHQAFVDAVLAAHPDLAAAGGRALDLGCGTADITVRLARALRRWSVLAVDGADAMLERGRARVTAAGLDDRVRLERRRLPDPTLPVAAFDLVVATSLLHHLADPATLWTTVQRCGRPGALVAVHDLRRPADTATADALVVRHAAGEAAVLRHDLRCSLLAAYTAPEVRAQLAAAGLDELAVEEVGDRHLRVVGALPR